MELSAFAGFGAQAASARADAMIGKTRNIQGVDWKRLVTIGAPANFDEHGLVIQDEKIMSAKLKCAHAGGLAAFWWVYIYEMLNKSPVIVIPAKAGIHLSAAALVGTWIPAFAGMTNKAKF